MKKLALHIGSHKTATTYLQNVFSRNADLLAAHDVLYPVNGQVYEAHHRLAWSLKDEENSDHHLEDIPVWQEVIEEIERSNCSTAVLSTEDFEWNRNIEKLASLAKRFKIQVVFYFRSPESYLESFYNQLVKDFPSREVRTIEQYVCEESLFFLDARHILSRWEAIFGHEAITVRLFDQGKFEGGIEHDFLRCIGCKAKIRFKPAQLSVLHKTSLLPDALEFLRLTNPHLVEKSGRFQLVLKLAERSKANAAEYSTTSAGKLSFKARRNILARFEGRNRAVARRYLERDENPFSVDAAAVREWDEKHPTGNAQLVARVAALIGG